MTKENSVLFLRYLPSVIKHRNNKQNDQRLNYKSPHVKRKKISYAEMIVYTVKIDRESDGKHNDHHDCPLNGPLLTFKQPIYNHTGKQEV